MNRLYSKATGSTYLLELHRDIPADAVPIDDACYLSVIANPAPGKIRSHDEHGLPILIDPPPLSREDIESARLRAYADPITGSDRYFAEAQRESLLGNAVAAEAAKVRGQARFAEIQAEHPWPTD
ncbi:phage tail protein [Pseudomonas sp. GD04158]|uniref:phage tail protein n=1 Tax=Pseudomonas sp. GD04158 TaxID=2975439 RepID=UPI00244AC5F4|nr:phage tail protein [Pseudomonas sp. GD04158]MDH0098246.1 phage tail protein [Pseudomonas sp. GD04158]